MARTFPTDGVSPCDFYAEGAPDRALGHFQWDLTGATAPAADAAVLIDINDATTISTGTIYGMIIDYAASGTKTGGGVRALAVNLAITANTESTYGISVYSAAIANKTVDSVYGLSMYMEDAGTACTSHFAINLGMVCTNSASEDGFMRMRNHGATPLNTIFLMSGNSPATHLLRMGAGEPYRSANVTNADGSIKVYIDGTTRFLAVYSS